MGIRVANAPVSWGVMEVEGWGPRLDYATFLDELAGAGYQGTELGPYGFLPTDAGRLRAELERRGLALTSAFVPLPLKIPGVSLAPLETVGRLLHALGARWIVLADQLWPEREKVAGRAAESGVQLTEAEWRVAAANVRAACEAARRLELRCVFHHHAGTYIETPAEIARLLEMSAIGLCLDTGHYLYGGGDPVEALGTFGERVEYLHFKDVDPERLREARGRKLDFLGGVRIGVFCELGAGMVRFSEVIQELGRREYHGWAVVEQDVDVAAAGARPPRECARAGREYLRNQLGV